MRGGGSGECGCYRQIITPFVVSVELEAEDHGLIPHREVEPERIAAPNCLIQCKPRVSIKSFATGNLNFIR
jgi:hypothetical protein